MADPRSRQHTLTSYLVLLYACQTKPLKIPTSHAPQHLQVHRLTHTHTHTHLQKQPPPPLIPPSSCPPQREYKHRDTHMHTQASWCVHDHVLVAAPCFQEAGHARHVRVQSGACPAWTLSSSGWRCWWRRQPGKSTVASAGVWSCCRWGGGELVHAGCATSCSPPLRVWGLRGMAHGKPYRLKGGDRGSSRARA